MSAPRSGFFTRAHQQQEVDRHFGKTAHHWRDLYGEESLEGAIHQLRLATTLDWIQNIGLRGGARVLDVGCGAGLLATDLARRGYHVTGIDTTDAMVNLARSRAGETTVSGSLNLERGDAHSLAFESCAFDLVTALGVVPFLHTPRDALAEVARVIRPGGWFLFSSDNKFRLTSLLDPRRIPFPGREELKRRLIRAGIKTRPEFETTRFSSRTITGAVEDAGLTVVHCRTLGFGPFTFLGMDVFREVASMSLNRTLQRLADRRVVALRSTGNQHLIVAQKPSHSRPR